MNSVRPTEDHRYTLYRWGAHLAWWGALSWTVALTYVNIVVNTAPAPPNGFQRMSGVMIVLLIGVAIACGSALSRMRLAHTITEVFEAGMKLANDRHDSIEDEIAQMHENEDRK